MIVMSDADVELSVKALAASALGCGGQGCMAGSVAVTVGEIWPILVSELPKHATSMRVGATHTGQSVDMGPLIRKEHVQRVSGYLDTAESEGAQLSLDGRQGFEHDAYLLGPSIVDHVDPSMRLAQEEIFGPVLSVVRAPDLESALAIGARCQFGNGGSIFTRDGHAAREFKRRFTAGVLGINVGVPTPLAWFLFTGCNQSFFGDLHMQGLEGVHFFTRQKTTRTRWFSGSGGDFRDPVWRSRQ